MFSSFKVDPYLQLSQVDEESDYPNIQHRHILVKSDAVSRKPNIYADHSIPIFNQLFWIAMKHQDPILR